MLLNPIMALECSLHAEKRSGRAWLEQILHPAFCEITRSGLWVNRKETIAALINEKQAPTLLSSDFHLLKMGGDTLILHYKTVYPDGTRAALRASHWFRVNEDTWQLIFHQVTPAAGSL